MKKSSLIIILNTLFLSLISSVHAADNVELTMRETKKNAISLSILDTSLLYSINYDHNFNKYFGLGGSAAVAGGGGSAIGIGGVNVNFYPVGSNKTALLLTAGAHMLTSTEAAGGIDSITGSNFYGSAGVGFEYRSDFLFRAGVNILFNKNNYLMPWPGFTFGYAF